MKIVFSWIQAHARQIATIVLWGAVMIAARRWPAYLADVELVDSAIALAIGIQLPPFKLSAQTLTRLVGGALLVFGLVLAACTSRTIAKDAYYVEKEGCIRSEATRAAQLTCLQDVDQRWNEAGAPAAATVAVPFDGGKAVLQ